MDPLIPSVSTWGKSFTHKLKKKKMWYFWRVRRKGGIPFKSYQVIRMPVPQI